MIDIVVGRPPTMNRSTDLPETAKPQDLGKVAPVAGEIRRERRKNPRDRRQPDDGVVVSLSGRPERRRGPDRRQKMEFLLRQGRQRRERRRNRMDRRRLVNDGVFVTLSSGRDRRKQGDRRLR